MSDNCLFKKWVTDLEHSDQAKVLPIIRGCDTESKQLKKVTIMLRWIVGENFINYDKYSNDKVLDQNIIAQAIVVAGRVESIHWYTHIYEAIEVISKKHPDSYVRFYWKEVLIAINKYLSIEKDTLKLDIDLVLRLAKERKDLYTKVNKLNNFLDNESLQHLHDLDQKEQLALMKVYLEKLDKRISNLNLEKQMLNYIGIKTN